MYGWTENEFCEIMRETSLLYEGRAVLGLLIAKGYPTKSYLDDDIRGFVIHTLEVFVVRQHC